MREAPRTLLVPMNPSDDLVVRFGALRVGYRLGWVSVAFVFAALALDTHARHRGVLLLCTVAAAVVNGVATSIPWREWLIARRGQLLLDLWCVGLIGFVALLVVEGGQSFALLLFLTVPFIAVVQSGRRRPILFAAVLASCVVAMAMTRVEVGTAALRLVVIGALVAVSLVVARTIRLQLALRRESDHRITNDLQAAADLLLLDGPEVTAQRIRAIAAVHRALATSGDQVEADRLLEAIAATAALPVSVDAEPALLDPTTAQRLGAVANELVTNACRHGLAPIELRLHANRLTVDDCGAGLEGGDGVGLGLVRRLVEDGMSGRFEVRPRPDGGTRAEVVWPR